MTPNRNSARRRQHQRINMVSRSLFRLPWPACHHDVHRGTKPCRRWCPCGQAEPASIARSDGGREPVRQLLSRLLSTVLRCFSQAVLCDLSCCLACLTPPHPRRPRRPPAYAVMAAGLQRQNGRTHHDFALAHPVSKPRGPRAGRRRKTPPSSTNSRSPSNFLV